MKLHADTGTSVSNALNEMPLLELLSIRSRSVLSVEGTCMYIYCVKVQNVLEKQKCQTNCKTSGNIFGTLH